MKLIPAILGLLSVATSLPARTIDINLHITGQDTITTGETAGYVPVAGVSWNNIGFIAGSGAPTADVQVKDDNGNPTAARFESTLASAWVSSSGAGGPVDGSRDMMASYLSFNASDSGLLRLSNLGTDFTTPGYKVYVYFDTDATNRTHTITVSPTAAASVVISGDDAGTYSGTFLQASGAGTAANFAIFTGLTSSSFEVEMASNVGRGAVNGIQIVSNDHPALPVISTFIAGGSTIPLGSSTTLSWESAGATSLSITPTVGDVTGISTNGIGSIPVTPPTTTNYTLTATNGVGSTTSDVIISVVAPAAPTIESFTATPLYFPAGGTTATLNWQTTDATTLTIDEGIGDVTGLSTNGDGNTTTNVPDTTTYTLTATNPIGSTTATVTIREFVPGTQPNILFFMVDDMGWQDTSQPFHTSTTLLNQRFRTPNMEALALQGRRFTQAYACSVCSPTRVSLMTGLNAARHKVTNWTRVKDSENSGTTTALKAPSQWNLNGLGPAAETYQRVYSTDETLPRLLQQAGYRTIHSGKAHFGASTLLGANPQNIGFDVNIAGSENGGPGSYLGSAHYGSGAWQVPGLEAYYPEVNGGEDIFLTEALTREINTSIETAVSDGVPFFAYMAHYAVHVPLALDPRFSANYPGLDSTEKKYATLVEGMDKSLGDILAKVDALGVAENTLVIFYSDNGGISYAARGSSPYGGINTHNWPLRAGKGSAYEGGTRVPFIAAWAKPDATNAFQQNYPISQNTICDSPVIIEDLMPTVLTAAGLTPPGGIDGFDITGYIQDTPGFQRPNDSFLFHYPHVWTSGAIGQNQGYEPYSALRDGDWKIIYLYHNTRWELYHLPSDLDENSNLTASNPDKFMEMARKMIQSLEERGAQYPENRTSSQPIPLVIPNLPTVDLDGDGVPDNVEDPNSNGIVDPGETDPDKSDTDGDTFLDGEEARAGTNPLDAGDFFSAEVSAQAGGMIELGWRSSPGLSYTIQMSETLAPGSWSVLASGIPAAESGILTHYLVIPDSEDKVAFYRIGVM